MKRTTKLPKNIRVSVVIIFLLLFVFGIVFSRQITMEKDVSAYEGLSKVHSKCFELRPRSKYLECMRVGLKSLVAEKSADEIVDAGIKIDRVRNVSFDREISCHVMMHGVGRALSEYKSDFGEVVSACRPLCGAGCYHGIMEGKYKTQRDITEFMTGACEGLMQKGNSLAENCFHGLGHAIAIKNWDLDKSLGDCDLVNESGRMECGAGVFMELFSRSEATLMPLPLDVPTWCNSFEKTYGKSCWLFAANIRGEKNEFLESLGIDTSRVENEPIYNCSKAPTEFAPACYKLFGYSLYDAKNKDGGEIVRICEGLVGGNKSQWCIGGVIERDFEETKFKAGIGVCDFIKSDSLKEFCLDTYKNPVIN